MTETGDCVLSVRMDLLRKELVRDEGYASKPYYDTSGHLTIGIGHNLTANGLPSFVIDALFYDDVKNACLAVAKELPNHAKLSDAQRRALVNMMFNLGPGRFRRFKKMLAALRAENYAEAAKEMRQSKWAQQVGARAERLAKMMEGKL